MDNTLFLGAIVGPYLLVMGLSFLLYAKTWVKVAKEIEKNHFVVVIGMALALLLGLAMIQMHNIWEWSLWVVITLFGWIAFLKGIFYFLAPGEWIKGLIKMCSNPSMFYFWGLVMAVIGGWMSYLIYIA
jgi:uncharacterized protein YjeT (DUF2065 family)